MVKKRLMKGPLRPEERDKISEAITAGYSDEQIAAMLNRSVQFISRARKLILVDAQLTDEQELILEKLKRSHLWKAAAEFLMPKEHEYFERSWLGLVEQFTEHGVLYTDEMMIRDLILQDILIQRQMKEMKNCQKDLNMYMIRIHSENKKEPKERNQAQLTQWHTMANQKRSMLQTLTTNLKELQSKRDDKMKQLKATREIRLRNVEEAKYSIWERLKMLSERPMREQEGRLNELAKLSAQKERLRLSEPIKYEDGTLDSPLLTPEQIEDGE